MPMRAGELRIRVERVEVQRDRREEGIVAVIDGAAPVMLEAPSDLEILVPVALRLEDRAAHELPHAGQPRFRRARTGGRARANPFADRSPLSRRRAIA